MKKHLIAEFLGSALLLATIVGSGIMGDALAGGNVAIALLANSVATGAMLFVLINIFGPVSGAHFNPLVTLAMVWTKRFETSKILPTIAVQVVGATLGVWLAHLMFDQSVLQVSPKMRWGFGQWASEVVATFGLLITILLLVRRRSTHVAHCVALYIVGAYWFTSSTSFANPSVTLARSLTDSFAGIAPSCVLPFIAAQCGGLALALVVDRVFQDDAS